MPRDVYAETSYGVPPDRPVDECQCGGRYSDDDVGHYEHEVVFGHRPIQNRGAS